MNYPGYPKTDTFKQLPLIPMDEAETVLYNIISDYPVHIDEITREGNMEAGEASSLLMKMELKGMIKQLPGKMFIR